MYGETCKWCGQLEFDPDSTCKCPQAFADGVASATNAKWTRELPTKPGTYWNAFRWPQATRKMYPEHSAYVVKMVTVFGVNRGGKLYVKDMLVQPMPLSNITTYDYDVWWIEVTTPLPP